MKIAIILTQSINGNIGSIGQKIENQPLSRSNQFAFPIENNYSQNAGNHKGCRNQFGLGRMKA
jgi:hypothetical protein